jgi:hypothetical protein
MNPSKVNVNRQRRPWQFEGGMAIGRSGSWEETVLANISSADITGTSAGQFGHANGFPLVVPQGTDVVVQLVAAAMFYDFGVAAYTAGGNITINLDGGGAALTGLVSAANSVGAASDKIASFVPLSTAGVVLTANNGLNLVSSAAFTQPGTATGVIRVVVKYRIIATGF